MCEREALALLSRWLEHYQRGELLSARTSAYAFTLSQRTAIATRALLTQQQQTEETNP